MRNALSLFLAFVFVACATTHNTTPIQPVAPSTAVPTAQPQIVPARDANGDLEIEEAPTPSAHCVICEVGVPQIMRELAQPQPSFSKAQNMANLLHGEAYAQWQLVILIMRLKNHPGATNIVWRKMCRVARSPGERKVIEAAKKYLRRYQIDMPACSTLFNL